MEKETTGKVISVSKQWWLKINTKPVRMGPLDGAIFPHIIKVRYTVDGVDYTCRKWIHAGKSVPAVDSSVTVVFRADRPSKARAEL